MREKWVFQVYAHAHNKGRKTPLWSSRLKNAKMSFRVVNLMKFPKREKLFLRFRVFQLHNLKINYKFRVLQLHNAKILNLSKD